MHRLKTFSWSNKQADYRIFACWTMTSKNLNSTLTHYHLQVQANPKKMAQKTDAIFSIYGKNGIIPWHFFLMTNGSKVLIYLTLLYFLLQYLQEYSKIKFNIDHHSTSTTWKGQSENLKRMSWDNPVSPIEAIFWVSLDF